MKTALILHWWGWNSSRGWLPWLQKELNSRIFDVFIPNLPNTNTPVLEEQEEYIEVYVSDFEDGWYIIGHSLWYQLSMNFIENNNIKNSVIVLVAPSYPWLDSELWSEVLGDSYDTLKKYYDFKNDFDKINKLWNKFIVFLSDNDEFINMESAKKYYSQLQNVEFREFENKWHFNQASGVLELEEILDYIK